LKSALITEEGLAQLAPPTVKGLFGAAWKVPSPLPSETETLREFWLLTARSALPSPLKSALVTEVGPDPTVTSGFAWKLPSPLPNRTETLLELKF
jgi:hypothetical protein